MTHDDGGTMRDATLHDYFMAHAPEKPNWFSVERDNPVVLDYSKMPKDYNKKLGDHIKQYEKEGKVRSPRSYFEKDPPEYLEWYDLDAKYSSQRLDMDTEHQIKTVVRWRSFYATAMIAEKRRIERGAQ